MNILDLIFMKNMCIYPIIIAIMLIIIFKLMSVFISKEDKKKIKKVNNVFGVLYLTIIISTVLIICTNFYELKPLERQEIVVSNSQFNRILDKDIKYNFNFNNIVGELFDKDKIYTYYNLGEYSDKSSNYIITINKYQAKKNIKLCLPISDLIFKLSNKNIQIISNVRDY